MPSYVGASTGAGDGDGALLSSTGTGDGALFSSPTTLLGGGVPAVSSPLVGVPVSALAWAGSSSTISVTGTAAGCAMGCSGAVCPMTICSTASGSVVLEPTTLPGSTSKVVLQRKHNPKLPHRNQTSRKNKLFSINLQNGASVHRSEDPSPSSPSRHRRLRSSWPCLLDVRGRRILGNPTSVARCNVGAVAGSADQGRGRLLLVIIVDNSNKPAALGRSAV